MIKTIKKKNINKLSVMVKYSLLIILAACILIPVLWVVMASVKQNSEFYGNPWTLPKGIHLQNFADAWKKARMGEYFFNSVVVTFVSLGVLLLVALPAAYVLARFKFKASKLIKTAFMGGLFINVNYIIVPIFLIIVGADSFISRLSGDGFLLNNIFVVAIVYAATALPFTIYLLSSYFATIPKAFEEAAYMDGAGYLKTMTHIMLPMATPSIITVILFNFFAFWNEYIIAMTLLSDPKGGKTLPVGLMNLMKAQNAAAEYGQLYAGLVIVMLPTLILYIIVQKKLTKGMTMGGVKG